MEVAFQQKFTLFATGALKHVHDGSDANKFGFCVFQYLRKAFDMVNKDILSSKLFTYGIRGLTHHLLNIYIGNRQQYVAVNSTNYYTSPIGKSVQQGSNLGTLLF